MNENCVREMTFKEEANKCVEGIKKLLQIPTDGSEPREEVSLLINSCRCIKKGIDELERIKTNFEQTQKERDFYRCELDKLQRENEIVLKAICKLIR